MWWNFVARTAEEIRAAELRRAKLSDSERRAAESEMGTLKTEQFLIQILIMNFRGFIPGPIGSEVQRFYH